MAQRVEVQLLCDMDHVEPTQGKHNVSFSLGGRSYEIDLCAGDARKFRRRLQKYVDHARKQRSGKQRARRAR